jgi:hypothetical protein
VQLAEKDLTMNELLEKVPWANLFRLIVSSQAQASFGPLGEIAADLILGGVLGLQKEEIRFLRSIDGKVTALLHGPYNTGVIHLTDAKKPQRSEEDRQKYIEYARLAFVEAHGQEQEVQDYFRIAIIQYHIAICWFLLGQMEDARDWFNDAYTTASRVLEQWHKNSNHGAHIAAIPMLFGMGELGLIERVFGFKPSLSQRQEHAMRMGASLYTSFNPGMRDKGKNLYGFIVSLKQLAESSILGLHLPPLSPSLYQGIFNVTQIGE